MHSSFFHNDHYGLAYTLLITKKRINVQQYYLHMRVFLTLVKVDDCIIVI